MTVRLGTDRSVSLRNAQGSTDLVVDLAGWYVPVRTPRPGPSASARSSRSAPTTAGPGRPARRRPAAAGGAVDVDVAGVGGVPADATAVVVNLTGIAPERDHPAARLPDARAGTPCRS